jgi:hypothetical protein
MPEEPNQPKPLSIEEALKKIAAAGGKLMPGAIKDEGAEEAPVVEEPKRKRGRPVGSGRGTNALSDKDRAKPYASGRNRPESDATGERRKRRAYSKAAAEGTLHLLPHEDWPSSKLDPTTGKPIQFEKPFSQPDAQGTLTPNFGRDEDYLDHKDKFMTSFNGQFPEKAHSHPWSSHDYVDVKNDANPAYRLPVPEDGTVTPRMRTLVDNVVHAHSRDMPSQTVASVYKGAGLFKIYTRDRYCPDCHPSNANRSFDAPPSRVAAVARLI